MWGANYQQNPRASDGYHWRAKFSLVFGPAGALTLPLVRNSTVFGRLLLPYAPERVHGGPQTSIQHIRRCEASICAPLEQRHPARPRAVHEAIRFAEGDKCCHARRGSARCSAECARVTPHP